MQTHQFLSKRATSAWNLCSGKAIQFSGTDDNPSASVVAQIIPEEGAAQSNEWCHDGPHFGLHQSTMCSRMVLATTLRWKEVLDKCVSLGVQRTRDVAGLNGWV
jgi:hypothetical protein